MRAEEQAKARPTPGKITFAISRKGAIMARGMGRWPVTLYVEQWERLFDQSQEFKEFVEEWEGKDYEGSSALKAGGEKVPYTARITRKVAA